MKGVSRRDFLKSALVGGTGLMLPNIPFSRALGANDDIRVAVVGVNGRGNSHIDAFKRMAGVRLVALCDVDSRVLSSRAEALTKENVQVQIFSDIRKLLESKEIDAISIATPNHWHSLMTIWACQAGKDVYVEKPCSHNVFEGRKCVEAARAYKRIVQHGTQSRSDSDWAKRIAAVKSGKYGKLLVSKGYCCKPRWSIKSQTEEPAPEWLDFNLWTGPAPQQPFHKNLVHYNWHWFWDFGNGDMGNQGVHQIDIARWAIEDNALPKSVVSMGGRWVDGDGFKDQGQTPNMELSVFDFGGVLLVFETRGLVERLPGFGKMVTNEFYMEAGTLKEDGFYPNGSDKPEPLVDVPFDVKPNGQFGNFIDCVRSRKPEDLTADIEKGHLSSALCHIGNISYRMGKDIPFADRPDVFKGNAVVEGSMKTVLENTQALGIPLDQATYRLGIKLDFDPATEQFVNNPEASAMLTRPYRDPFTVPSKVV